MRKRRRVVVRRRVLTRRLRYHPATRWIVATVVVLAAVGVLQRARAIAADAEHRWGDTHVVVVARHDIAIGASIGDDAVELQSWPSGLVPSGAVDTLPVGRVAIAAIGRGEAIVAARLGPDGLRGLAALVPDGWRALAIPVAPSVITLSVGDHVDLIAGFDVGGTATARAPSLIVAHDAIVVAVDEQRVTVAVPSDDAERVALAIVAGTVVPALRTS